MLSAVHWPKDNKVICFIEKIDVLDQIHPSMRHSTIGYEFNVMN